jgi:hypothetical protein
MSLGDRFGWTALAAAVVSVLKHACMPSSLKDCFELLLQIAPSISTHGHDQKRTDPADKAAEDGVMAGGQISGSSAKNGGESGAESGERASAEGPDWEKSAAERATMCERIIPRSVAKICKGPVAERPYGTPVAFSLKDVSTASVFVGFSSALGSTHGRPPRRFCSRSWSAPLLPPPRRCCPGWSVVRARLNRRRSRERPGKCPPRQPPSAGDLRTLS